MIDAERIKVEADKAKALLAEMLQKGNWVFGNIRVVVGSDADGLFVSASTEVFSLLTITIRKELEQEPH